MVLTTTDNIEGFKITEYKGIVSGNSTEVKTKFSFKSEKNKNLVEEIMNKAKEEAFQKLRDHAAKMNANAVVGISVDMENFHGSYFFVSATGTAVTVAI